MHLQALPFKELSSLHLTAIFLLIANIRVLLALIQKLFFNPDTCL